MNTFDRFERIPLAEALRNDLIGSKIHDWASTTGDEDDRTDAILRAIRAAGGDREAAITAGHRALARSVTTRWTPRPGAG